MTTVPQRHQPIRGGIFGTLDGHTIAEFAGNAAELRSLLRPENGIALTQE